MTACRGHPRLRTIALNLVLDASRLARLWIDQLHIRHVDERLFIDNPAAPVRLRVGLLMPLDHPDTFDSDLALCRVYFEHPPTAALVASGNDYHLIIFSNLRALCSGHLLNHLRRE